MGVNTWEPDRAEDARAAVMQALGAASMCWKPTPTGEFVSERAVAIGEGLIAFLQVNGGRSRSASAEEAYAQVLRLHSTTDAAVWAKEFANNFPFAMVDEGTMLGWFANAIEVGKEAGRSEYR